MSLSATMNAKLNEQIGHEFAASQAYLAMSCMLSSMELASTAALFRKQSDEERGHALKFLEYIVRVHGTVRLAAIPEPRGEFKNVVEIAQAALEHEQKVTQQIHALVALADQENDYATRSFLQYFVDEQVEELELTSRLLQVAKMARDNLLQLDAYVGRMMTSGG